MTVFEINLTAILEAILYNSNYDIEKLLLNVTYIIYVPQKNLVFSQEYLLS